MSTELAAAACGNGRALIPVSPCFAEGEFVGERGFSTRYGLQTDCHVETSAQGQSRSVRVLSQRAIWRHPPPSPAPNKQLPQASNCSFVAIEFIALTWLLELVHTKIARFRLAKHLGCADWVSRCAEHIQSLRSMSIRSHAASSENFGLTSLFPKTLLTGNCYF